jgi:hypothetical protein
MIPAERWLPVTGFEGFYEVSNLARVRSFHFGRVGLKKGRANPDGYPVFVFYGGGRRKTIPLHRLVALTFLPDGKNILHNEVGHLDGNRANAAASNLKWVSKIENHFHRRAHGTHPAGEQHPRAKLTDEQVRVIRQRRASSAELAAIYGVSQSSIFGIWQRRRWAHVA